MSPVPKEERDKPVDDNPECNNVENDDSVPDFIITLTSSESEAESDADVEYDGYELLPQDAEIVEFQPPSDISEETGPITLLPNFRQPASEESQNTNIPPVFPFTVPDPPAEDAASLLWNQGIPAAPIEMDKGQEDRVRAAMKGFQLPSNNIPDWAKNVPEDKWKEHLLDKLQQLDIKEDTDDREKKPDDNSQNEDSCLK